jgi:hypothetical protein
MRLSPEAKDYARVVIQAAASNREDDFERKLVAGMEPLLANAFQSGMNYMQGRQRSLDRLSSPKGETT